MNTSIAAILITWHFLCILSYLNCHCTGCTFYMFYYDICMMCYCSHMTAHNLFLKPWYFLIQKHSRFDIKYLTWLELSPVLCTAFRHWGQHIIEHCSQSNLI